MYNPTTKKVVSALLVASLAVGLSTSSYSYSLDTQNVVSTKEETEQVKALPTAGVTSKMTPLSEVELEMKNVSSVKATGIQTEDQSDEIELLDVTESMGNEEYEETHKREYLSQEDLEQKYEELVQKNNYNEKLLDQYETDTEALRAQAQDLQNQVAELTQQISEYQEIAARTVHFNPYDVREISGASPEVLNQILQGTWLEGYGQIYYDYENTYGINAMFSIGNAFLETGWIMGESWLGSQKNNIYGLDLPTYFSDKTQCIDYWYKLISEHYVGEGLYSTWNINVKYCPPNPNWADHIKDISDRLITKAGLTIG